MDLLSPIWLLSLIVFIPATGALVVLLIPRDKPDSLRFFTLAVTLVTLLASVVAALPKGAGSDKALFELGQPAMQNVFAVPWITFINAHYSLGIDGISLPLVLLTTFLFVLAMGASWNIDKAVKAYCSLFLLLEAGVLGVFLSLDLFLFYVFWEVMLLPMYFLIGIWGGPNRLYAALKFFLFTLFGGVLMLIAILVLYFASDLRALPLEELAAAHVPNAQAVLDSGEPVHTLNFLALQKLGQTTQQFNQELFWGCTNGWWIFLLLFIGFLIKVPGVPFHTWLPDAHVEAPTPISMILAGVLLKLGGYGIIRICYPICPHAGYDLANFVCGIGIVSMVYGAFAAMAQTDFKRLVAYSSVSHMGYVVLGVGAWGSNPNWSWHDWSWGMNGAMFQMVAHGISSAGMFFMVGVIYDRVHHRNLNQYGGVYQRMPLYSGLAIGIFFAGLGLPGLCGFIGEAMVTFSLWDYSHTLTVVAATVVLLTAGYILWTLQRVYLGTDYHGPHGEALTPITPRETAIAAPLLAFAILLGILPQTVFSYMKPSVDKTVQDLTRVDLRQEKDGSVAKR